MLVCCAMKVLLVGLFVVGGGTSGFALSTGQWLLLAGGLLLVVVGGVFYARHRRGGSCSSSEQFAD